MKNWPRPSTITDEIAQTADRLGYHTLWMAEHHFQREGYECLPNLLMQSVHLAHITKNLKFGCAFNVPPMWNPLRLAEDYALADHLTDGRVIFGVGRGYHTREVESFGAPMLDRDANRDYFEEQVEVIFKAFNNRSFSHHGKYFDIPPKVPYRGYELEEITLVPRPKHLPVECWQPIVSSSQRGIDFMIKHGIKGISGGGAAPGGASRRVVELWRDSLVKSGRKRGARRRLDHRREIPHSRQPRESHRRGSALFRGKHEDVWPLGICRWPDRRAEEGPGKIQHRSFGPACPPSKTTSGRETSCAALRSR